MTNRTKALLIGAALAGAASVPAMAQAWGNAAPASVTGDSRTATAARPAVARTASKAVAESSTGATAQESDGSEVDQPITGPDLERAMAVALDYLGQGKVTGTEIEDEESYYEVEVTLQDGSQVDVQLDEQFNVVGSEQDGANSD